jgi:hypothetical protein
MTKPYRTREEIEIGLEQAEAYALNNMNSPIGQLICDVIDCVRLYMIGEFLHHESMADRIRDCILDEVRFIRTDLGSCGLLTGVFKLLLFSDLEHWFESKSRASGSTIALGMSPFGVFPQVGDHGFEGATIPGSITVA